MNDIGFLNTISFILILATVIVLSYKFYQIFKKDESILLIIISFGLLFLVTLTNVLEHLNITTYFDLFEDEMKIIFIPMFIFAIFSYNLKKELHANIENKHRLQESNARLNMSMEGANEALWIWQPNQKQLIINKEYCFLNFEPIFNIINDSNFNEIIHKDSLTEYLKLIDAFKTNSCLPVNTEIQLKTSNEEYKWVLIRGKQYELTIGTEEITFLGTIFDIDYIKKVQSDLTEARIKAEESNHLKSAFLANLSHEIRTPMNGILGFTELLKESDLSSPKRFDFIEKIQLSGNRLLLIINDIVEISKIDSGQIIAHLSQVDINNLLVEVYNELQFTIPNNKAIKTFIKQHTDSPIITITDKVKLQQILVNLFTNAIKYTDQGFIEVGFNIIENRELEFYVKDTGIGIEKKYHEVIFERFRQLNVVFSNLAGSGLGLSITKAYVELLGGKIWLESEVGKGSIFYFTIPLKATDISLKSISKFQANNQNKLQNQLILVAEDDDVSYQYIQEVLLSCNCQITRAINGMEAIEICKNNPLITLVLMDIKMPKLNGIEATKSIKGFRAKLPIIAQTAYAFPDDERKAIEAGCDAYISKPIVKEKLIEIMQEITKKPLLS